MNIRWVTIMLTPVSHVSAIKPQIMKVRKDLRNLAARLRRKDARADSLRMLGAFESDWYFPHHVPRLSGYKRRQLEDIGFDYTGQEVWFPHLHMLVDLGGASEYRFRELLERKWPGYRRVDFKTLDGSKTLAQNVQNLMGYTLKCKHRYDIDPFRSETASTVRWPADVVEKYHIHLQENGSFAMLRFHLRPARTEQTFIGYDDEYIDDYMPVVV